MHYYNEFNPRAAAWLRQLMARDLIPVGDVDERSIADVQPDELAKYTQCHFFAGIGGWAYAARLAGWPDDRQLWTGSCPCQPFSTAGQRRGTDDARHLWPHFARLVGSCRPAVVMGEQVAGTAGYGWFDGVRSDLARENYASRCVDIPACSVDAPHWRSRLYWVAEDVADAGGVRPWRMQPSESNEAGRVGLRVSLRHADRDGAWSDSEWVECYDGKLRRGKPGLPMLADGLPDRVAALFGFGNAIVPQLAAEVISAYMSD